MSNAYKIFLSAIGNLDNPIPVSRHYSRSQIDDSATVEILLRKSGYDRFTYINTGPRGGLSGKRIIVHS